MPNVTSEFLDALKMRRLLQAKQIVKVLKREHSGEKILDYACGQGLFVELLLNEGFDAFGCDISSSNVDNRLLEDRFIKLIIPWSIPEDSSWTVVSMLDVLEHADPPGEIIHRLIDAGAQTFVIKVPMLHGPIGTVAKILAKLRRPKLLERLLLVGEISPHYTFFTSRGLIALFAQRGFHLERAFRIADVGSELPKRLRGAQATPLLPLKNVVAKVLGFALEALAPLWSDTRVFLFRRNSNSS